MAINIGALLSALATVAVDVEVDEAELEAGQVVQAPIEPQVATLSGKAVYVQISLSESKQSSNPSPTATISS